MPRKPKAKLIGEELGNAVRTGLQSDIYGRQGPDDVPGAWARLFGPEKITDESRKECQRNLQAMAARWRAMSRRERIVLLRQLGSLIGGPLEPLFFYAHLGFEQVMIEAGGKKHV